MGRGGPGDAANKRVAKHRRKSGGADGERKDGDMELKGGRGGGQMQNIVLAQAKAAVGIAHLKEVYVRVDEREPSLFLCLLQMCIEHSISSVFSLAPLHP